MSSSVGPRTSPVTPSNRTRTARPTRTRWRRWVAVLLLSLLTLALAAVLAIGWYFSGQALTVTTAGQSTVTVEADGPDRVWLEREGYAAYVGEHGLRSAEADAWLLAGGTLGAEDAPVVGIVGEILDDSGERVLRSYESISGQLPEGPVEMVMAQDVYWPDPSALDLPFEEVELTGELGPLPSWVVPATGDSVDGAAGGSEDTWAIFVHGRGGSREEALRYLPTLRDAGLTTLAISYRNDPEAPPDPNGRYGLGETEWRDVESALTYAREQGADQVLLLGWSMGAAISLQTLDRSPEAELVTGLWLDAPVIDWRDTFYAQGELNGLPRPLTWVAQQLIQARGDLRLADFDWVARADELPGLPIHIEHSDGDTFVPNGPSKALAEKRPDIVTLNTDSGAEHTRTWNADPEGYDARLAEWLTERASG
ncbi:alpha/beta hydrolase family protein [Ornithinimicrobium sp. Y1847]|uniref:alpha/beta hydrolase family protein n=1 Tax=Ornithinimicrobium sp. Y1847 TaxID=3405419 RepID=UPI003B66D108